MFLFLSNFILPNPMRIKSNMIRWVITLTNKRSSSWLNPRPVIGQFQLLIIHRSVWGTSLECNFLYWLVTLPRYHMMSNGNDWTFSNDNYKLLSSINNFYTKNTIHHHMAKITLMLHLQPLFEFVLPTTVAVAQLHIHYVEYSAMAICNCALREIQTEIAWGKITIYFFMERGQLISIFSTSSFITNYRDCGQSRRCGQNKLICSCP